MAMKSAEICALASSKPMLAQSTLGGLNALRHPMVLMMSALTWVSSSSNSGVT